MADPYEPGLNEIEMMRGESWIEFPIVTLFLRTATMIGVNNVGKSDVGWLPTIVAMWAVLAVAVHDGRFREFLDRVGYCIASSKACCLAQIRHLYPTLLSVGLQEAFT